MKPFPGNLFDEKRREMEDSLLQLLDLNLRKPTEIAIELLTRIWGFLVLVFVFYLMTLGALGGHKTYIYIWGGVYISYLLLIEYIRSKPQPLIHNYTFRLIRIFCDIAFISCLIGITNNYAHVFGLFYIQPIFTARLSFPTSKARNFLVIATSIAGLFTSAVLLSPGLSPSLWQFSVTSSVVLIFSFYLALASRITPLTKERELPIDEITSLFTSIKMDFKGDILNLALDYPQTLNVADFRNLILPLLQSLTRLNYVLSNLALPTLIIKRISYNSPLEISLGGWIPETINALREWAKDKKWRNEHEKNIAVLEIAKTEANLRLTQLEIKGKEIEYAKQLIDLVAPRNISKEQKKILVSRVIPELKLLTSPKVYLTFNDEDNTSVD